MLFRSRTSHGFVQEAGSQPTAIVMGGTPLILILWARVPHVRPQATLEAHTDPEQPQAGGDREGSKTLLSVFCIVSTWFSARRSEVASNFRFWVTVSCASVSLWASSW